MATKKSDASATTDAPVSETVTVEEPVVIEEPAVVDEPVVEDAAIASDESATVPPPREVIVVDAPVAPRAKGNRGLGVALALLATLVFTAVLVGLSLVIPALGGASLLDPTFYFPSLLFFIGLVLVTLVLNRAGWWSHIIGSVIVGLIVWFGSASLVLVAAGMVRMNQTEANETFYAALFSPILIVAALLGREVAIWTGAILARRGRRLKVVNSEARAQFEREQAELIPTV